MHELAKIGRAARNRQIELRILQHLRPVALLPVRDLFAKPIAQALRKERAAVEEHSINARTAMQKFGEMPGDRAVEGIGETPIPSPRRVPASAGRPPCSWGKIR